MAGHGHKPSDVSASDTLFEELRSETPHAVVVMPPPEEPTGGSPSLLFAPTPEVHVEQIEEPTESPSPHTRPQPLRKPSIDPRVDLHFIPPQHKHRTLVLCFDGTGDEFDCDNSNVVQLVSLLKKDEKAQQMVYYQTGIGTYTSPDIATPLMNKVSKIMDSAVAWNLDAHVMDGYEFLMQNYTAGDKICIFGFSRGAYIARSLAGMIHKVGLLPADNWQQVPFAYKMYTRTDGLGWEQSKAFKRAFSNDVGIDFIGVWDTVDSVGLLTKRLPFATSNTIVRVFRHAVSLDERRAKFKANLWNRPTASEAQLGSGDRSPYVFGLDNLPNEGPSRSPSGTKRSPRLSPRFLVDGDQKLDEREREWADRDMATETDIKEVWFSGCHSDVGGGSVNNKTRHSLARIPLRWMIRECFKANTGIMFKVKGLRKSMVKRWKKKSNPSNQTYPTNPGKSKHPTLHVGSEEEEELKDALSPIYDQLTLAKIWWVLEVLPLPFKYQRDDDIWEFKIAMNLARPRIIPRQEMQGVLVHRSVKTRMEVEYLSRPGTKYSPVAKWAIEPTWVD
ncbi:hypothetical protein AX16_001530 [Volvariella volvacea WC 439]|nr:hypothetical protein AX16_001530 [Volvariella volvacea WC 439]